MIHFDSTDEVYEFQRREGSGREERAWYQCIASSQKYGNQIPIIKEQVTRWLKIGYQMRMTWQMYPEVVSAIENFT